MLGSDRLNARGEGIRGEIGARQLFDEATMIYWSVAAGLVGVLGTWFGIVRLDRQESHRPPEVYWLLGMAALAPAWLIAFLGLLGRMTGRFPEMFVAVWFILSASAAIAGVILADATVRGLQESGQPYPQAKYWLVGIGTFLPAWCIALLGLVWT